MGNPHFYILLVCFFGLGVFASMFLGEYLYNRYIIWRTRRNG